MTYTSGAIWHVTLLDGKTITWVTEGHFPATQLTQHARITSVLDPESTEPARRVLKDGTIESLGIDERGLTVYGTHVWDRPTLNRFREIDPEYAYLADGVEQRRGITHHSITSPGDHLLTSNEVADKLDVKVDTIYRYRSQGLMPQPDEVTGRTPRWRESTIDNWERPGRGAGGGRPHAK